jgi:hypothetical protein
MLIKNNRTFVKCVLIIWLVINVLELIELTAFILLLLNCSKWYIVIYVRIYRNWVRKIFEEPDSVLLFILLPLSITLLVIDEEPDTKFVFILFPVITFPAIVDPFTVLLIMLLPWFCPTF